MVHLLIIVIIHLYLSRTALLTTDITFRVLYTIKNMCFDDLSSKVTVFSQHRGPCKTSLSF